MELSIYLFIGVAILLLTNQNRHFDSNYIEFTQRRVAVRDSQQHEDQEISFYLKSPTYLDIIIKPRKDLLLIRFEQYGETIGKAALPSHEVPYMLDSLSDLLHLKIHDTRSTNKQEDVLYLRPIGSAEDLIPSYLKITDNQMRLIVNPVSNQQNFIINYQRKIIKTATGKTFSTDDIRMIILKSGTNEITITGIGRNIMRPFTIIRFETKSYDLNIIKKDLELFAGFLKSKDILQHIQMKVK